MAGRFEDSGEVGFVVPEDSRMRRHRLLIAGGDRGDARNGDLVVARLLEMPTAGANARARVVRVVDTRRAADLAAELAIVTHGLPREWSPGVLDARAAAARASTPPTCSIRTPSATTATTAPSPRADPPIRPHWASSVR